METYKENNFDLTLLYSMNKAMAKILAPALAPDHGRVSEALKIPSSGSNLGSSHRNAILKNTGTYPEQIQTT